MEELKEKYNEKDRNYKDGELCLEVCRAIDRGVVTGKDINDFIGYQGSYKNFRSAFSKIKKRGYIKFTDDGRKEKNPFKRKRSYALTVKGQRFLQNPNERWEYKQARIHQHVMNLLEKQPDFLKELAEQRAKMNPEKVIEYVNSNMGMNYTDVSQVDELIEKMEGNQKSVIQDNNSERLASENSELRLKYNAALSEIQRLKSSNGGKSVSPQRLARDEQRRELSKHRRKLAQHYHSNRMYLDSQFFSQWQNIVPVKVKGAKWFTKNSVEFISKNNKEFGRGHVVVMNPEQIYESQFYITEILRDGITIGGKGVAGKIEMIKF